MTVTADAIFILQEILCVPGWWIMLIQGRDTDLAILETAATLQYMFNFCLRKRGRRGLLPLCARCDRPVDLFDLFCFRGEQAQLLRLRIQLKISSFRIISSAWFFRLFIIPTHFI